MSWWPPHVPVLDKLFSPAGQWITLVIGLMLLTATVIRTRGKKRSQSESGGYGQTYAAAERAARRHVENTMATMPPSPMDITQAELSAIDVPGLTTAQFDRLWEPHKRKWMKATITVKNVKVWNTLIWVHFGEGGDRIHLIFDRAKWYDRVAMAPPGSTLRAKGQISRVYRNFVTLENCEIIEG